MAAVAGTLAPPFPAPPSTPSSSTPLPHLLDADAPLHPPPPPLPPPPPWRGRRSGGRDLCSRAVGDRWGELLTPEPANAAAVALSAALAWAGASLLLQLALISFAIFATCRQDL
ncbi:hypothetical protein DAI22_12g068601 [Oryza sativa Japonica Group]|nr:hypothetical protein DAI22_12g068601 [Oryza sativa Japonica Group]